ncbi:hypothetical protein SAMN06265379_104217 [Saccharicrinis carchari]|uniref:Long-chain fatty acid transport protein n=1 Tax=Saccharicrinis carchari TaxID=1168039 RepID=A0A521D4P7_SACCC|nr:hypothetical protein [Saccharicrinis carchari]SMO66654.1 hypothetical protein SAMN06265379_104217 [Saccharicrinis carchari]
MLKINKLVLVVLAFLTITPILHLSAQQRTYSPLSRFGLGESQNIAYGSNGGMATTGIGIRSSYGINALNIASLTALDSLSFYFDGGVSYFWQSQETGSGNIDNSDMLFDYIAVAFSVSPNVSYTVGFKPVSGTGYKFLTTKSLADGSKAFSEISGNGNLTEAYFGVAVQPIDNFSVGANLSYLFGNLRNISRANYGGSTNALNHGVYNEVRLSTMLYDFGAQYTYKLDDVKSVTLGLTYRPKIGLSGSETDLLARGVQFGDDNNLFDPTRAIDTLRSSNRDFNNNEIEYASSIGVGLSYKVEDKLQLGLDYKTDRWGDAAHFNPSFEYTNTQNYSIGAEFIPNDRSASSYLNRVRYRAGAYYHTNNIAGYLDSKNEWTKSDLYNYGITFGLGLPLKRSKTSINLSVEVGKRNADGHSNDKQSYGKLKASFSLHEFWFRKRQFD